MIDTVRYSGTISTFVAVTFLLLVASPVFGETVIGRWCDRPIPNMPNLNQIMEIVLTDEGTFELRSEFGDGSSGVAELEELSSDLYSEIGSASGDKYRIVASDGNLQLLDDDGIIRVARRLENTPQSGECF